MKMFKRLLVVAIAVGATAAVMTSIFSGSTAQAATTLYSSGTMVDLSADAVVCPDGAMPGDATCTPLTAGVYKDPKTGKIITKQDDCRMLGGGQGNGNADCIACCANGPWAFGGGKLGKAGRQACEQLNQC